MQTYERMKINRKEHVKLDIKPTHTFKRHSSTFNTQDNVMGLNHLLAFNWKQNLMSNLKKHFNITISLG